MSQSEGKKKSKSDIFSKFLDFRPVRNAFYPLDAPPPPQKKSGAATAHECPFFSLRLHVLCVISIHVGAGNLVGASALHAEGRVFDSSASIFPVFVFVICFCFCYLSGPVFFARKSINFV